jgi:hypothetical protein
MKLILIFIFMTSSALQAKIYFVNRGVKYHIGDNHYEASEDREFVGTYPVVGQEWIQAFRVSEVDVIKVSVANIWGVDDCPYCKVIVGIDDHDMGRLTRDNNHEAFNTLQPLAMKVEPGKTYLLKVVSYGDEKVDDFVIEGVSVETARAEVRFLKPGPILKMPDQPMPVFSEETVERASAGPCPGLLTLENWELGPGKSKDQMLLKQSDEDFASSGRLGDLKPGETVEFFFQAEERGAADKVGRAFEILSGEKDNSGWVFTLDDAGRAVHGNLRWKGNYRSLNFAPGAFKARQWNRARLSYCPDGSMRLSLNGAELDVKLALDGARQSFFVRALGITVSLAGAQKF